MKKEGKQGKDKIIKKMKIYLHKERGQSQPASPAIVPSTAPQPQPTQQCHSSKDLVFQYFSILEQDCIYHLDFHFFIFSLTDDRVSQGESGYLYISNRLSNSIIAINPGFLQMQIISRYPNTDIPGYLNQNFLLCQVPQQTRVRNHLCIFVMFIAIFYLWVYLFNLE